MLPYGDLAYTLGAWPNHHRALNAISRYQMVSSRKGEQLRIPAECWFQRAIQFSPRDATTRMLYAMHLQKVGKLEAARAIYVEALELDSRNIQLHYNYGLLLAAMKNYPEARRHAKIAYDAEFPLPGLRNQLSRAGHWP
ncbi:hypothetical protein [Kineobactrum sediminis]|nr:hypothetical protein [Kineobactrum sediminis]